jgi:hypothetical protein
MTQAIAGVSPHAASERTVMTIWPSNSYYQVGRWLGRLYNIRKPFPDNKLLWPGNLFVIGSIPIAIVLYFARIAPYSAVRFRLTNRRVIVEKGMKWVESKSVALDKFDSVTIEVQPGQEWYQAGDLVFRMGETVVFRLEGVPRPESFRHTLIKSHMAYVGVNRVMGGPVTEKATAPA